MIYTSYFSSKKYKRETGVSIARWCNFWHGMTLQALYPSKELLEWWTSLPLSAKATDEAKQRYEALYRKQTLSKLHQKEVAILLEGKT